MRCKEFDAHMDEMLSGVVHPDANEHMRQCERCTSYFRARAAVQNGLRALAASSASPSRATDRAVMDSYRRLQERRAAAAVHPESAPRPAARLFSFPSRGPAARGTRHNWTGLAVAAMLLAMIGSGMRLWNGTATVGSPNVAGPTVATLVPPAPVPSAVTPSPVALNSTPRAAARHALLRQARLAHPPRPVLREELSGPNALQQANADATTASAQNPASGVMHLASTAANGAAQAASSTWPGYSNLMYCDPVVCSGPMQVIQIQVPANEVQPSRGQSDGKSFVNADVVVGPDGVARAIRVAN